MMTVDLEGDITLHIMPNTVAILITNKCLMATIPEVLVQEDEVDQAVEVELDRTKNIFETHDMPMTIRMVAVINHSSITQEAIRIEVIILTIQEEALNQVTLTTTDV